MAISVCVVLLRETSIYSKALVFFFVLNCALSAVITERATLQNNTSNSRACFDGKPYISLLKCRTGCKDFKTETNVSVPDDGLSFKLIILNEHQYELDGNGQLVTSMLTKRNSFSADYYDIGTDKRAYVCHPMTKEFKACRKWYIPRDIFEYNNTSQTVHVNGHQKIYEIDEFFLTATGDKVRLCVVEDTASNIRVVVQLVTVSLSAIFLSGTVVLAFWIPALNIKQNYVLMCHLLMLCAAYVVMAIKLIVVDKRVMEACIPLSTLQQYFFLSAFLWINSQAFDTCRKLKNLRWRIGKPSSSERNFRIVYSCYSWGVPFVYCVLTLAAELLMPKESPLYPAIRSHCWFRNDILMQFIYFYAPICFVLMTNLVLFAITVYSLFRVGNGIVSANKKIHQQLFILYLKLAFVMGFCWTMDIASWAEGDTSAWWYVSDIINSLQGVFIFIIYICKRSQVTIIMRQFKKRAAVSDPENKKKEGSSGTKSESLSNGSGDTKHVSNQSGNQPTHATTSL